MARRHASSQLMAALGCWLVGLAGPWSSAAVGELLTPQIDSIDSATGDRSTGIERQRTTQLDLDVLVSIDQQEPFPIELHLFDDVELVASIGRKPEANVWTGQLDDDPHSSVTFVVHKSVLTGIVRSPVHGLFRIHLMTDGL